MGAHVPKQGDLVTFDLTELVGTGAGSAILGVVLKILWGIIQARRLGPKLMKLDQVVYTELTRLCSMTPASRAFLVKAHNGGGVPRIDRTMKATVTHEIFHAPFTDPIYEAWQNAELDLPHRRLLIDVHAHEDIFTKVEDLADGRLKQTYLAQGVAGNLVCWIAETPGKRWRYIALHTVEGELSAWDEAAKSRVIDTVHRLRQLFLESGLS
jgi:hypothetical protein